MFGGSLKLKSVGETLGDDKVINPDDDKRL